jgi:K+-transporting ATPase ATPase C chain
MKQVVISIRCLVILSILCGVVYPLTVTALGKLFSARAGGSLIKRNGEIIGSELLAQKFSLPKYFWARPSSADYATVASGASNLGPTSKDLKAQVSERRDKGVTVVDALAASGSGLDPHISPENARVQAVRVAIARKLTEEQRHLLQNTVELAIEGRQFGFFGEPRVNVLLLNLEVDRLFP